MGEDIKSLQFLVLDEADRMIETGHFAELDNILQLTQREFQCVNLHRYDLRDITEPQLQERQDRR